MRLELAIADAFGPKRHRQLVLNPTTGGRWQASLLRPEGSAYCIHVDPDPVAALSGVLRGFGPETPAAAADDDLIG